MDTLDIAEKKELIFECFDQVDFEYITPKFTNYFQADQIKEIPDMKIFYENDSFQKIQNEELKLEKSFILL
jgi:hypothetical protein